MKTSDVGLYIFVCTTTVDVQLVPELRRGPAGRGCAVEAESFASRDIRYAQGSVSNLLSVRILG